MKIINGIEISRKIKEEVKEKIRKNHLNLTLATILIGDSEASKLYINLKEKVCNEVGIKVEKIEYSENTNNDIIINRIKELNSKVNGILVQLPLPKHLDKDKILNSIDVDKDVDGLTSDSLGNLILGNEKNAPCTPKAVIYVLEKNNIKLKGKRVVLVGHGNVGKPLSIMLLNRDATLEICNEFTSNLKEHTLNADVLISCAGVANLINKEMVKEEAVVIDVGINKKDDKIVGDVDEGVKQKASLLCSVPGGIGPLTIAMLIQRLVK